MIRNTIIRSKDRQEILIEDSPNGLPIIVSERFAAIKGVFKSVQTSGPDVVTVTEPDGDGSIVITDIIIGTDKVNGSTVTLQFTDGTNTIIIYQGNATDVPINLSISFQGRWQGWRGAGLELVTTGINFECSVAVGYFKTPKDKAETFEVWDSMR